MDYLEKSEELSALLHSRLGARGSGLDARIRRAGRALPGHVRRDAAMVAEAARMQSSPKLARLVDEEATRKAYRRVVEHLEAVDPVERRKSAFIGILASSAFSLLVVAILFVAALRWRGFV